jgi:hypothetical protein
LGNRSYKLWMIVAVACLGASGPAFADYSQAAALLEAANVQKQGSDSSLQNSTTQAMQGLMDLAAQKRASAIQHGYKAYGQYLNSEELDNNRLVSKTRFYDIYTSARRDGVKPALKFEIEPTESYTTTYNRLDPKFLYEGEAGKVAAEFERKSGMKREAFLKIMARASESTISPSDPKMVDKVFTRFEAFVKEIPNDDFRKSVEKAIQEVPATVRSGMIAKGVQKVAELMAKGSGDKNNLALAPKADFTERKPAASVAVAAVSLPAEEAPTLAAATESPPEPGAINMKMMVPSESGYRGLEKEKFTGDLIGSVMQTALDEQKEETIFKQVSKRYRALTPKLSLLSGSNP